MECFASSKVLFGLDVLEENQFAELDGCKVGLITNHTGVNRAGKNIVDILHDQPHIHLKCIFTPEHGFRGKAEHGKSIEDSFDAKTGVPVYSLYGRITRPNEEMLKEVDTLVFDIQDIGSRFYTYIATMGQALEEASKRNLRFVVLDRPNPIRGDILEGDILDPEVKRLTGYFPIPTRHGFTVGELAGWVNQTQHLSANLTVIKMKNWKRSLWYDQTGQKFYPTSPNIRTLKGALLYSGIGCFEATNISVGRGTEAPFEIFGAPWLDGKALSRYLKSQTLPGIQFRPHQFVPTNDLYAAQITQGVKLIVTNRNKVRPFHIFVLSFLYLYEKYPKDFVPDWEEVKVVTGSNQLEMTAKGKMSVVDLLSAYDRSLESFQKNAVGFYLY